MRSDAKWLVHREHDLGVAVTVTSHGFYERLHQLPPLELQQHIPDALELRQLLGHVVRVDAIQKALGAIEIPRAFLDCCLLLWCLPPHFGLE